MTTTDLRDQLIVGLDVPTITEAEKVVEELGDAVSFYKIGYQLVFAGGLDFAKSLVAAKKKVFLDMKLLDIDNTIAKGVENVAKMGVSMLTLHAYPKAMRAAVEAARGSNLCLLGAPVLPPLDNAALGDAGIPAGRKPRGRSGPRRGAGGAWAALSLLPPRLGPSVRRSARTWPSSRRAFVQPVRKRATRNGS